jgi:hypothetical protein
MCNRGPEFPAPLPSNMEQKLSSFDHMTANSIVLESGEEIIVDSVIYCTGYQYDFPFLPDGIVKVEDTSLGNDINIIVLYSTGIISLYRFRILLSLTFTIPSGKNGKS